VASAPILIFWPSWSVLAARLRLATLPEAISRWPNYLVDIGPQRLHIREPGTEVEGRHGRCRWSSRTAGGLDRRVHTSSMRSPIREPRR
jgi:hypothetical protein